MESSNSLPLISSKEKMQFKQVVNAITKGRKEKRRQAEIEAKLVIERIFETRSFGRLT
jgi:hypothetical protein